MSSNFHIFIISLADAAERRAPLIATLAARGVSYEIFDAIDGRKGLDPKYETMIDRDAAAERMGRVMVNAEFACALSHHYAYREIAQRKITNTIILEDDAIVGDDFFEFLGATIPAKYDLILLDHARGLVRLDKYMTIGERYQVFRIGAFPHRANGYVISLRGAQEMINRSLPIIHPADWPFEIAELRSFAAHPRIVDHPDDRTGPSHIRDQRSFAKFRARRRAKLAARHAAQSQGDEQSSDQAQ